MIDWHRIGQRVICIDSFSRSAKLGEAVPELEQIYTIREITIICDHVFFRLDEIVNCPRRYAEGEGEAAFDSCAFRPVINAERDLAVFEAILRGVEREVVEA